MLAVGAASLRSGHGHNYSVSDIRMSFNVVTDILPLLSWLKTAHVLEHGKDLLTLAPVTPTH